MKNREIFQVLTPRDMKRTEEKAFSLGVNSLLLMERAANAVVDALEEALGGCYQKKVLFLCGKGNNGGDGLAAARLFRMRGGFPEIWLSGEPQTPDAKTNLAFVKALDIPVWNVAALPKEEQPFTEGGTPKESFDGYVDALLGTGMRGMPDELTTLMINVPLHDFSCSHHPVIAVDIPSGINGLTGEAVEGAYMQADVTVTFHAPKPGLYLTSYREAVGKIRVADIGLWDMDIYANDKLLLDDMELNCQMLSANALRRLSKRAINAHKGDCGRIVIYAGALGMCGAAAMCAEAAIAAGAGLTTLLCPRESMPVLQKLVPNAMCVDIEEVMKNPPAYDVLVVGPGLGQGEEVWRNILALYDSEKKAVFDADALNLLAKNKMRLGKETVITPHLGEAARLLGVSVSDVQKDRFGAAKRLCEAYGCTVVLKSDITVIAKMEDGETEYFLNAVGSPALAKGGSGDVLAGMMAVCLHEDVSLLDAAANACLWHGQSSVIGAKKYGLREMTAKDLIGCFREAREGAKENGI